MNFDSDVNVRAARNLVATVTGTLRGEQQAISTFEQRAFRHERALRRAIRAQKVAPTVAAVLTGVGVGIVMVAGVVHGVLHLGVDSVLWGALAIVGIPSIGAMFVADRADQRAGFLTDLVAAERSRITEMRDGLGSLKISVAESEDVLRRVTAEAAAAA